MGIYTENSLGTIQVPSTSGVLSDSNYSQLSPKSYMLDDVIAKYTSLSNSFYSDMSSSISSTLTEVEALGIDTGTKFFSINGEDIGIMSPTEETSKIKAFITKVNEEIEEELNKMTSINNKLNQVEGALSTLVSNYKKRENEINTLKAKLSSLQSQEQTDSVKQSISSYSSEISSLESQLESDNNNTMSSINVSWFCAKNN